MSTYIVSNLQHPILILQQMAKLIISGFRTLVSHANQINCRNQEYFDSKFTQVFWPVSSQVNYKMSLIREKTSWVNEVLLVFKRGNSYFKKHDMEAYLHSNKKKGIGWCIYHVVCLFLQQIDINKHALNNAHIFLHWVSNRQEPRGYFSII